MSDLRTRIRETIEGGLEPRRKVGGQRVAVVVPDHTRPIEYGTMVTPLLEALVEADAEPFVFVGMGLHRPMTEEELAPLRRTTRRLGLELVQHDAGGERIAELRSNVAPDEAGWPTLPARCHREVLEADRIVSVGTVEPHQYAGFSGGPKGVAIGCGGEATIGAMHGLEFLRRPETRLGGIEDNPFHEALWRLIEPVGPIEGLQIVPGTDSTSTSVCFGSLAEAFEEAVEIARSRFFESVEEPYDWLHLPVSAGKASNVYQASRAATYVALVERPAIVEGGTLVVDAACPEGVGTGTGEQACADAMRRGRRALFEELQSDERIETRGGEQRAYVIARTLEHCDVVFVGTPPLEALDAMGIAQFDDLESAEAALELDGRGATIEDVFHRVPVLR